MYLNTEKVTCAFNILYLFCRADYLKNRLQKDHLQLQLFKPSLRSVSEIVYVGDLSAFEYFASETDTDSETDTWFGLVWSFNLSLGLFLYDDYSDTEYWLRADQSFNVKLQTGSHRHKIPNFKVFRIDLAEDRTCDLADLPTASRTLNLLATAAIETDTWEFDHLGHWPIIWSRWDCFTKQGWFCGM